MEIWWILLIVLGVVVLISAMLSIANYSHDKLFALHEEMKIKPANTSISVLEFISEVNNINFDGKLKIARTTKYIGDGYARKSKTLVLSDDTLNGGSISAFAISAHELGHALQDKEGNILKVKFFLKKLVWFLGKLFLPSLVVGLILFFFPDYFTLAIIMTSVSAGIFLLTGFLRLFIVYIEKDASKRAIGLLKEIFSSQDLKLAKKYLNAARLTYWSDFMTLLFGWTGLTRKKKNFGD